MILTKGSHQGAKFQTFDCSSKFHQICTLIGSFCWKYKKFQQKKKQRSYVSWHWRVVQNLNRKQFVVSKMTRIWWFLIQALKIFKKKQFDWSLLSKYIKFDLKKYRRVIFYDTKKSCKIWRKTELWFGKWHEAFGKFPPEHFKLSKLVLSWNPFVQSRK